MSSYMGRVRLVLMWSLLLAVACTVIVGFAYPQFGALLFAAAVFIGYAHFKKAGTLDSHGTARWATLTDLEKLTSGVGVIVGRVSGKVSRWVALRYLFAMPWLTNSLEARSSTMCSSKPHEEVCR